MLFVIEFAYFPIAFRCPDVVAFSLKGIGIYLLLPVKPCREIAGGIRLIACRQICGEHGNGFFLIEVCGEYNRIGFGLCGLFLNIQHPSVFIQKGL